MLIHHSYSIAYPVYEGAQYDASVTNLTYRINPIGSSSSRPVTVVLSFLSPVTPTSLSRQSLPASYLAVFVEGGFDIDIYVDVNGQWASGSRDSKIQWELTSGDRGENRIRTSWSVKRTDELLFTEINDRAEWGTFYFSGPPVSNQSSPIQRHLVRRCCC